jgi:hypothetical protein
MRRPWFRLAVVAFVAPLITNLLLVLFFILLIKGIRPPAGVLLLLLLVLLTGYIGMQIYLHRLCFHVLATWHVSDLKIFITLVVGAAGAGMTAAFLVLATQYDLSYGHSNGQGLGRPLLIVFVSVFVYLLVVTVIAGLSGEPLLADEPSAMTESPPVVKTATTPSSSALCKRCQQPLVPGAPFCGNCGEPTAALT